MARLSRPTGTAPDRSRDARSSRGAMRPCSGSSVAALPTRSMNVASLPPVTWVQIQLPGTIAVKVDVTSASDRRAPVAGCGSERERRSRSANAASKSDVHAGLTAQAVDFGLQLGEFGAQLVEFTVRIFLLGFAPSSLPGERAAGALEHRHVALGEVGEDVAAERFLHRILVALKASIAASRYCGTKVCIELP